MKSMKSDKSFRDLVARDRKVRAVCKLGEIDSVFDIDTHLRKVDFIFSRVLSKRGRPKK